MNNEAPSQGSPIKFDLSFTPEVDIYIQECQKDNTKPTVKGFATRIKTDVYSVWAWANKKKKDENGKETDQLARPNFHAALTRLYEMEKKIEEETRPKLNPKQELFCQLYAKNREFFGNATKAYAVAYGIDTEDKDKYRSAKSAAFTLLTNIDIVNRCKELLSVLTNEEVDQELAYIVRQNYELPSKIAAIREWNKLHTRITDKVDLTSGGQKIAQIVGFNYLPPATADVTNNTDDQANA